MKTIPLSFNASAIVDDEDFELLIHRSWRFRKDGRSDAKINGKRVLMHRFILNAPTELDVDHIDGNPLNNQRSNLRLCSSHKNTLNQVGKPKNRSCSFKGISPKNGGFVANIGHKDYGGFIHIGWFESQKDAAIAYDIFAKKYHADFARLNLPNATEEDIDRIKKILDNPKPNIRKCTSMFLGVGWKKRSKKWRARVLTKDIGYFNTEKEAVVAYNEKAKELGLPINII